MLGLILIYFIGKKFYDLAQKFGKSEWGFAILGVVTYYAGTFITGIVIALGYEFWSTASVDGMSDLALGFIALPFGVLSCVGLYYYLNNLWGKSKEVGKTNIDDIGVH